jgi:CheY-like chemotaxis protein
MPEIPTKLLIVDDESSIRTSMSLVLTEIGYRVWVAEDGFSALLELRKETPDILVCDLNMPGMSGFEFLTVVRRRFPHIRTIAMSGAFSGDEAPSGIAADAFYHKGSSLGSLLQIMESLRGVERALPNQSAAPSTIWIQGSEHAPSGSAYVNIACPECLRTFPQPLDGTIGQVRETNCTECGALVRYAIVEPASDLPAQIHQSTPAETRQERTSATQSYN